jgi:hypothetical protein
MKKFALLLVLAPLLFVSCGGSCVNEKDCFVKATSEAACEIFGNSDAWSNPDAFEEKAKGIFAKYGFDVDDEEAMNALSAKYENDEDVMAALTEEMADCSNGAFDPSLLQQ